MTDQERMAFIRWLRMNIDSSYKIEEGCKNISLPSSVAEALMSRERAERAAYAVVLRILESTEAFNLTEGSKS